MEDRSVYNKKGFINIAIILIAALVVGAIGYLAVVKNIKTAPNSSEIVAVATSTIDTSNWKTYKSDKFGFEFKYPSAWVIREFEDAVGAYPNNTDSAILVITVKTGGPIAVQELSKSSSLSGSELLYTTKRVTIGNGIDAFREERTEHNAQASLSSHTINYYLNLSGAELKNSQNTPAYYMYGESIFYTGAENDMYLTEFNGVVSTFSFIKQQ